jgi:hypothetical protein
MLSPAFAAHFMNAAADLYSPTDPKPVPKALVQV